MYSYNRYAKHLQAQKINAAETTVMPSALNGDGRLLSLLDVAIANTASMANRYSMLYQDDAMGNTKELVKSMYIDELKNMKQLQDMYFQITQQPYQKSMNDFQFELPTTTGADLLEETLMMEMDDINFLRDLMLSVPSTPLRDIMYEVITDKQNHTCILNYLLAKNFA